MSNEKDRDKDSSTSPQSENERLAISEWERLIRAEEFGQCPICGGEFVMMMGCRKICRCGYMEGCED